MANDTTTAGKPGTPQSGARPATPGEALASAHQVEELADRLSACADSLHERVMRDIHAYQQQGKDVPDAERAVARALLDAEGELRQRANRLYADAAACIVSALGQSQQHVIQLTTDAAAKLKTITRIGDGITLVARLLGLAAAASTGQVLPILAALTALKTQVDTIALHNPPPAAPAPAPSDPAT